MSSAVSGRRSTISQQTGINWTCIDSELKHLYYLHATMTGQFRTRQDVVNQGPARPPSVKY